MYIYNIVGCFSIIFWLFALSFFIIFRQFSSGVLHHPAFILAIFSPLSRSFKSGFVFAFQSILRILIWRGLGFALFINIISYGERELNYQKVFLLALFLLYLFTHICFFLFANTVTLSLMILTLQTHISLSRRDERSSCCFTVRISTLATSLSSYLLVFQFNSQFCVVFYCFHLSMLYRRFLVPSL
ncbi:hypothetical protein BJ508DRAFT_3540 [Ascobolus immersus RN42]|uniref:Uncharacterized protein n=1 Tax=Ascobolus immersus RN42 TaxID=1160509 RepID=A0A3N4ITX0_ASCIM|nr:hypothetical protein BJ508DRAFT_3540 [Ascobolus immersus RN42]